ncbi:MAG: hypothetical protein ABIW82_05755 [Dokdonella sp.]
MRLSSMPGRTLFFALGLLALTSGTACARTLTLTAQRVHDAHFDARDLRLVLVEHADGGSLQLSSTRLEVSQLALGGQVEWTCSLQRRSDSSLACSGPIHFTSDGASQQSAELALGVALGHLDLTFAHDGSRVLLALPLAADQSVNASLQHVPAAWLKAALASVWPGGELRDGELDAEASVHADGGFDLSYAVNDAAFNTLDGTVSGAALDVTGHMTSTSTGQGGRLLADATFTGGSLQVGAMHAQLPATPLETNLDAIVRRDGHWDIARFAWRDPRALVFEASGELDPSAFAPLRALSVRVDHALFPLVTQRYGKDLLAAQGLGKLELNGELSADFALDEQGLQRVALATTALDVDDGRGRIAFHGLRGGIGWAANGERPATSLAWKSGRLDGFALSAASSRWQSKDGALRLIGSLRTKLLGGTLALSDTTLYPQSKQGDLAHSRFALDGIGYDSKDGSFAASKVKATGSIRFSTNAHGPRVQLDATFHGGELLASPAYVNLPQTPVSATLDATLLDTHWRIDRFSWADPGVLAFSATGEIAATDAHPVHALQIDLREAQLSSALDRYAHSWLSSRGYADLQGSGSVTGALELDADGLQHFAFNARDVDVRDGAGRFSFAGVDGGIDWDARRDMPATRLSWKAIELLRIPLTAASAELESSNQRIVLTQGLDIGVLGGKVRVEKLSLQPDSPRGERYAGSFAIAGIQMAQLSAALGWPLFPGNLSGGIPEIEFVGDKIELHGGLDLYVFDGHLGVSGLSLEHPFSDVPVLGADVHFENLDLDQVTSAFSFGGMSGRLAGTIGQLNLVSWSPVSFDAWLRTDGGGRMSYKAINDVTAIAGGGGLSDNLQTMALKLVNTFGYGRLGLRCRLLDKVCLMGGIDPLPADIAAKPDSGDYTIVEGSGLPRITIVGHRRRVDWPTLVSRLQAAMQGQAPVIQ